MAEDYRCKRCGAVVSVNATQVVPDGEGPKRAVYAAWCRCAQTSPADKDHRGVGHGETPEAAIAAWRNWTPEQASN